jgi:lysophospholipase L1-like esterase
MAELGLPNQGKKSILLERIVEAFFDGNLPCPSCKVLEARVKALEDKLAKISSSETSTVSPKEKTKKKKKKNQKNQASKVKKVLILADSMGRNCSSMLQEELGSGYKVSGIVKPGAPLEEVVRDCKRLAMGVDLVLVQAGTNDLTSRKRIDFQSVQQELSDIPSTTKIILGSIPPRFDRPHLNRTAREYNRHMESLHRVSTFNPFTYMDRTHFTNHGLHMNAKGKRLYVKNLASQCLV